jgi:hypothetical protein
MTKRIWLAAVLAVGCSAAMAQKAPAPGKSAAGAALTIYNQDFALVRTPLQLELKAGTTEVSGAARSAG